LVAVRYSTSDQDSSSRTCPSPCSCLLTTEAADEVRITRFTVPESSHCRRITRAASRAASAGLLYCTRVVCRPSTKQKNSGVFFVEGTSGNSGALFSPWCSWRRAAAAWRRGRRTGTRRWPAQTWPRHRGRPRTAPDARTPPRRGLAAGAAPTSPRPLQSIMQ